MFDCSSIPLNLDSFDWRYIAFTTCMVSILLLFLKLHLAGSSYMAFLVDIVTDKEELE